MLKGAQTRMNIYNSLSTLLGFSRKYFIPGIIPVYSNTFFTAASLYATSAKMLDAQKIK